MIEDHEQHEKSLGSKVEMVERLIGLSRQHDAEDLEFWRNATDEVRGKILCGLLEMVNAVGNYPEKKDLFPGFSKFDRSKSKK